MFFSNIIRQKLYWFSRSRTDRLWSDDTFLCYPLSICRFASEEIYSND